ncbi:MAG: hypothetical protein HC771_10750 [Synechococcales cyanobacterium CRU_2_2]|nr:hypothetical protein [Synechococcales cyanobacterium CRU_2_2]
MTNPVLQSFYIGRALAEGVKEQVEKTVANALSEVGKFDAEQRERLRVFSEQVMARAQQEGGSPTVTSSSSADDLQESIDDLRAEVALLRSKLQEYRNQQS